MERKAGLPLNRFAIPVLGTKSSSTETQPDTTFANPEQFITAIRDNTNSTLETQIILTRILERLDKISQQISIPKAPQHSAETTTHPDISSDLPIEPTQTEIHLAVINPSHPIDHVKSKNLTPEQQHKIKEIRDKKCVNIFAEDWINEYYVIHYPENTIEKLEEDEKTFLEWKNTISSKHFSDTWILKHYFIYFPLDYKKRHSEGEKAYNSLYSDYYMSHVFASPGVLKDIAIYYYEDSIKAIQRGISLYEDLKGDFFDTKLINSNPYYLSNYIIHNLNNPKRDIEETILQYDIFLSEVIKTQDVFFNIQNGYEIGTEAYLRLLFKYHSKIDQDTINRIKSAYRSLQENFGDDNFFGIYKNTALKQIAILSTDRPIQGYKRLKLKINDSINFPTNKGKPDIEVIGSALFYNDNGCLK
jgi:hypothetical protein